ncbi:MAG: hypothetical protein A2X66_06045 [Ignavibacteria bacterium GWA2_54_16]|nr:MAG: hypothetical protein A2X66_06045 [Ignavibacteria bacterium GWA2_54_16]
MNCSVMGLTYGTVSVNITDQPVWGPTGYDHAQYYYIPEIDAYYSVYERQYIYRDGSSWIYGTSLPSRYSSYDPYRSYKVVINEDKPYRYNDSHREKYKTFKGTKNQQVIRDSRDPKYFEHKDHPEHDKRVKEKNR